MALVDVGGGFLKVNRSLCEIIGYTAEELEATDFQSITHPDDLEADVTLAQQLMSGAIDHYHMEKRYYHKSGRVVWIQLSASLARDDTGQPQYAIAQIQDITARKIAEQQAARRLQYLQRLTDTVSKILQTLESSPDEAMYPAVLEHVMHSLRSPAGLFLRVAPNGSFTGPYICETGCTQSKASRPHDLAIWEKALRSGDVVVSSQPMQLGCGRNPRRSLVAAITHAGEPLGLFHLGDAEEEYDDDDADLLARITTIIAPVLHARIGRDKLTPREAEVMDMIVEGLSQKQIATALRISVQTTAKHRARVLEKLNLRNDVELVRLALRMRPLAASGELVTSAGALPNIQS